MLPRAGDVLHITKAASVQFEQRPILFRVIRIFDRTTYDEWIWLDGYELSPTGDAVERRSIFVKIAGLRAVGKAPDPRARNGRPPSAAKPGQRTTDVFARRTNRSPADKTSRV